VWLDAPLRPAREGHLSGLAISEEEAIRSNKRLAISGQLSAISDQRRRSDQLKENALA